jgi:hypothetical protein
MKLLVDIRHNVPAPGMAGDNDSPTSLALTFVRPNAYTVMVMVMRPAGRKGIASAA